VYDKAGDGGNDVFEEAQVVTRADQSHQHQQEFAQDIETSTDIIVNFSSSSASVANGQQSHSHYHKERDEYGGTHLDQQHKHPHQQPYQQQQQQQQLSSSSVGVGLKRKRSWCCFPFLYVAALFAIIGGFNFGYDLGVITNTITPISLEFRLSPFRKEVIVRFVVMFSLFCCSPSRSVINPKLIGTLFFCSSLLAGAAVGSLVIGWMSDRFGRKKAVMASSGLFLVGSVLLASATSFWMLLAGRIICGLATGASLVTMIYLAELAPASKRGTIVGSNELSITFGIFLSLALGKILVVDDDGSENTVEGAAYGDDSGRQQTTARLVVMMRSLLETSASSLLSSSSSSSSSSTSGEQNVEIGYNLMTWRIMFIFLAIPSTIQMVTKH